ncbi:dihydrolipoyl dehydrogenase [bacterium]
MKYDIAIIGSGPGGYSAALSLKKKNYSVCLIEKEDIGGVCLNRGCIPTKVMAAAARKMDDIKDFAGFGIDAQVNGFDYKKLKLNQQNVINGLTKGLEFSFKKAGVDVIKGFAEIKDRNTVVVHGDENTEIRVHKIIIATGSMPFCPPCFESKDNVVTSETFWKCDDIPDEVVIVGGGVIGCEYASSLSKFGVKVTIVEMLDKILYLEDVDVSTALTNELKRQGIKILCNKKVEEVANEDEDVVLRFGDNETIKTKFVIVCTGRKLNLENIGLENIGIIDFKTINNSLKIADNIWIAGDIASGPQLAHKAYHDAHCITEQIIGNDVNPDYSNMPITIFTIPEISRVGLIENELEKNHEIKVIKVNYREIGKAVCENHTRGFMKLIFDKKTGVILNITIVGYLASEINAAAAVIVQSKMKINDLGNITFSHPTLSELLHVASIKI